MFIFGGGKHILCYIIGGRVIGWKACRRLGSGRPRLSRGGVGGDVGRGDGGVGLEGWRRLLFEQ